MFEPKTPAKWQHSHCDEIPPKQVDNDANSDQSNNFKIFSSQEDSTCLEPSTPPVANPRPTKRNSMATDLNLPPRKKPKKKRHIPRVVIDFKKTTKSTEKSDMKKGAQVVTKKRSKRTKRKIWTTSLTNVVAKINGENQRTSVKCSLKFDLDDERQTTNDFPRPGETRVQDSAKSTAIHADYFITQILDKYTSLLESTSLPTRRQLIRGNFKWFLLRDEYDPSTTCEGKHKGAWETKSFGNSWGRKASRTAKYCNAKPKDYTGALEIVQHKNYPFDDMVQRKDCSSKSGQNMVPSNLQNAMVPYNSDNQIILYKSPVVRSKKQPLFKVDMDAKTEEMWNLLVSKEAIDIFKGTDKEKETWLIKESKRLWEKAETFLSRMHAIQGDRRFSRWDGTILDSAIGVFLTQNVSDSLSSSTFINLASRFPPKQTSNDNRQEFEDPVNRAQTCQYEGNQSTEPGILDTKPKQNNTEEHTSSSMSSHKKRTNTSKMDGKLKKEKNMDIDWDDLRKEVEKNHGTINNRTMDSVDWEAVRCADVKEIAECIKGRGQNNVLAQRIKDFLNRIVKDHGSLNLEWLMYVPADKAEKYLISVNGLGPKSVECLRLLTLHHAAFPVDTNVARIVVRLGWVPIQPLPESLQLHLLESYPIMASVQKYLWPRLCMHIFKELYELHYQMISFGKILCTKRNPNCNECPMKAECKHFASAFASSRLALPHPEEKGIASPHVPFMANQNSTTGINSIFALPEPEKGGINSIFALPEPEKGGINSIFDLSESEKGSNVPFETEIIPTDCNPIIEEPPSPEPECDEIQDIEDFADEDPDEMPSIDLPLNDFFSNVDKFGISEALVVLNKTIPFTPTPKLKNSGRLRTEHQVYELPDSHPLLKELEVEKRVETEVCPYLLAIWTPGETAESTERPETCCGSGTSENLCSESTCFSCNCKRELNSQIVRGTLLIPCKTAMKGRFPLNGTYFQVNQVFSDDETSRNPISVPRSSLWNLKRRTVYCAHKVQSVFSGLSLQDIQSCCREGYICLTGFNRKTRRCHPLVARLHPPVIKNGKAKKTTDKTRKAKKDNSTRP